MNLFRPNFITTVATFVFAATTAFAQAPVQLDMAFGASQRGYYVTALKLALRRLEGNPDDAIAMALIGALYRDGTGVKLDLPEAARWFRLAADRGDTQARFALGMMLLEGNGLPRDRAGGIALLEQAASKNHAGALANLGIIALEGQLEPADLPRAIDLLSRAADLSDPDATYALALLYQDGKGVRLNPSTAASLFARASELGHLPATVEYAIALFNGIGTPKNEALAIKLFLKAAYRNNPIAQNRIARLLATGQPSLEKDIIQAMKWHMLARATGVQDEWLEIQLNALTPVERSEADLALQTYVGN